VETKTPEHGTPLRANTIDLIKRFTEENAK